MNSRSKRPAIGIAFLLLFSITQVHVGASFNAPDPRPDGPGAATLVLTGTLITSGRQPISVNGNSAVTDATILTGALIATPQGVSATVDLAQLGRLDIASSTNLKLEFVAGRIKVTLYDGCVVLRTKRNTTGTIETPRGVIIGVTDPAKDDVLDVCQKEGAAPLVNQGAAANAGAGAGSGAGASAATAAGASTAGGLSQTAGVVIGTLVGGGIIAATLILPCDRGDDPSPPVSTDCR